MARITSISCVFVVLLLFSNSQLYAYTKRDLLQKSTDLVSLQNALVKGFEWVPYPAYHDRSGWDRLLGNYKDQYIARGEKALSYQWNIAKVSDYLEYDRTGSLAAMSGRFSQNIISIVSLFMAELAEGKGRFIDQLANGVFATCEMTSWVGVEHLRLQLAKTSFPNHKEQVIDLYSGDVGSLFSWIYYFLNKDFDKLNPLISIRIKDEIQRKILHPYMTIDHLWWMAFNYKQGDMVNNWNPWCNSNVLQCFALMETDPEKLAKAVYRIMTSVDHFINYNNEDGACEEGPSYWGHAAGKLYDYLQVLYDITGGKVSIFNQPLIKNMGEYISRAYVGNGWVVNFADASAKLKPDACVIYRYGKAVNSVEMMRFAAYLSKDAVNREAPFFGRDIFRLFQSLLHKPEENKAEPVHQTPVFTWYPQTQFCFVREGGLFFAAKGGYNAESHNHNDVGSFNLYLNDVPFIIDAGVGNYTKQTFSSERYSIWTMQSSYHNLPEINGFPQSFGAHYKARNSSFSPGSKKFALDISNAYPKEAGVEQWHRSYTLQKNSLTITDDFRLKNALTPNKIRFLTSGKNSVQPNGNILIAIDNERMELSFDKKDFNASIDTVKLEDQRLAGVWGNELYRITLTGKDLATKGIYTYKISRK